MMTPELYTQLYLNILLLQDLASILIGGYFSNKNSRQFNDSYILGRIQDLKRRQNTEDAKTNPIPVNFRPWTKTNLPTSNGKGVIPKSTFAEGIAGNSKIPIANPNDLNLNVVYDEAILNYDECYTFLENKIDTLNEETSSRNFSLFSFYNSIINLMCSLCLIKVLNSRTTTINDVCAGDYVLLYGTLNINTVSNYVDTLINILNDYGTTTLDTNFDNSDIGPLTYATIVKLLTTIQTELAKGNSTYVIIKLNEINAILSLSNTYITIASLLYDSNNSPIIAFGKVSNVIYNSSEELSVFDKTGLPDYYRSLLESFTPYLQVLNDNGFYVPTEYISSIHGPALQLIPVSIYI